MSSTSHLETLTLEVYDKIDKPVNVNVVRAALESMGIRNQDALTDYKIDSLQELAQLVFNELRNPAFVAQHPSKMKVNEQFKTNLTSASDYLKIKTKYFFYYYPLGLFHGVPVFLQIATIILFGYSMWTYDGFNSIQSTAVVLGVIFGLIGTGGFVQMIGRQVSHYNYSQDYVMARKSTIYAVRDSLIFMGALSALFLIINFFADLYPYKFIFLLFVYSFSIGILLLLSAVFHPLKRRWVIIIAFVLGAGVSLYLKLNTDIITYYTHWIGIWLAISILFLDLTYFFKKKIKNTLKYSRATTKSVTMLYRNYKYFFYGLIFFIFIFIDRFLAWSTKNDEFIPYVIFYEKNYEIGMDIAILIFFLLVGVLEFSIASFSTFSDIFQKSTPYNKAKEFNTKLLKLYWQHVTILLITGVVMIILLYLVIWQNLGYERAFNEALNVVSIKVSLIGGLGYIMVAWGMLNSLYLFTLNRPSKPLNAILVGAIVNLVVGLIASRLISYEYSVLGMLAGSTTYMLMTLKSALTFFRKLDYYYYAAY